MEFEKWIKKKVPNIRKNTVLEIGLRQAFEAGAKNDQKRAKYWKAEILALRAQADEIAEALTVIWLSDDRAAWDGKAVEHFDALLAKIERNRKNNAQRLNKFAPIVAEVLKTKKTIDANEARKAKKANVKLDTKL